MRTDRTKPSIKSPIKTTLKPMQDLEKTKQDVQEMKGTLNILKKDSAKIDKILTCLTGDDVTGAEAGLVFKIRTLEEKHDTLKEQHQNLKDTVADHRHTINQLKFVVGIVVSCIILFLINKILNQPPTQVHYEKTIKN